MFSAKQIGAEERRTVIVRAASRQLKMQAMIKNFPRWTSMGSLARWRPRGVISSVVVIALACGAQINRQLTATAETGLDRTHLDERGDSSLDIDLQRRVEGAEKDVFDGRSADLHDLDPQGEVLQREAKHLGLGVLGHLDEGRGSVRVELA